MSACPQLDCAQHSARRPVEIDSLVAGASHERLKRSAPRNAPVRRRIVDTRVLRRGPSIITVYTAVKYYYKNVSRSSTYRRDQFSPRVQKWILTVICKNGKLFFFFIIIFCVQQFVIWILHQKSTPARAWKWLSSTRTIIVRYRYRKKCKKNTPYDQGRR